jgi:hypothetical protein
VLELSARRGGRVVGWVGKVHETLEQSPHANHPLSIWPDCPDDRESRALLVQDNAPSTGRNWVPLLSATCA